MRKKYNKYPGWCISFFGTCMETVIQSIVVVDIKVIQDDYFGGVMGCYNELDTAKKQLE